MDQGPCIIVYILQAAVWIYKQFYCSASIQILKDLVDLTSGYYYSYDNNFYYAAMTANWRYVVKCHYNTIQHNMI